MKGALMIVAFCLFIAACAGPEKDMDVSDHLVDKQPASAQSDCSALEAGSQASADCYSVRARDEKDKSLCALIEGGSNEALRVACFSEVAAALQDESVCDQMTLPSAEDYQVELQKGTCKEFVKSQSGIVAKPTTGAPPKSAVTLEQCQAMTDQEQMTTAQCYFKVAVFGKDTIVCDYIVGAANSQTRIMCYSQVAAALKDPSVCETMNVPDYPNLDMAKQQCRSLVTSR
jgi:hypothetical protein